MGRLCARMRVIDDEDDERLIVVAWFELRRALAMEKVVELIW